MFISLVIKGAAFLGLIRRWACEAIRKPVKKFYMYHGINIVGNLSQFKIINNLIQERFCQPAFQLIMKRLVSIITQTLCAACFKAAAVKADAFPGGDEGLRQMI